MTSAPRFRGSPSASPTDSRFRAGPTYVLTDDAARTLAAALITSAVWARETVRSQHTVAA